MSMHDDLKQMKAFLTSKRQAQRFNDFWSRRQRRQNIAVDPQAIAHEYTAMSQFLAWTDADGCNLPFAKRGGVHSLQHEYTESTKKN